MWPAENVSKEWAIARLTAAIKALAMSPAEQIKYVDSELMHHPEELALQFEDAVVMVPQLLQEGVIRPNILGIVADIGGIFDTHSGLEGSQFWTEQAISVDPDWQRIRDLAGKADMMMNGQSAD